MCFLKPALSSRSLEESTGLRGPDEVEEAGICVGFCCDVDANMFGTDFCALGAAADVEVDEGLVPSNDCDFAPWEIDGCAKLNEFVFEAGADAAGVLLPPKLKLGAADGVCEAAEAGLSPPRENVGLKDDVCDEGEAPVDSGLVKLKDGLDAGVSETDGAVGAPKAAGLADGVCAGVADVDASLPRLKNGLVDCGFVSFGTAVLAFGVSCAEGVLDRFANGLLAAGVAPLSLGASDAEGVLERFANGLLDALGAVAEAGVGGAVTTDGCIDCYKLDKGEHDQHEQLLPFASRHLPLHALSHTLACSAACLVAGSPHREAHPLCATVTNVRYNLGSR